MFENIEVNFHQSKRIKSSSKNKWTKEDSEYLFELVNEFGTTNWRIISNHFENRNPRQVREHYLNNLVPNIDKSPFTEEEIQTLKDLVSRFGFKWASFRQYFPNRSDSFIKNQWNSITRTRFSFSFSNSNSLSSSPSPSSVTSVSTSPLLSPQFQNQNQCQNEYQNQNQNQNEDQNQNQYIIFDDTLFDFSDSTFFDEF
jgi:hypothetical protein